MRISELTTATTKIKTLAQRLREACENLNSVDAAAEQELQRLLRGDLRYAEVAHQRRVRDTLRKEIRDRRVPTAGVALYEAGREAESLIAQLETFKRQAQRAPDAETAYLGRAKQAGVSEAIGLQIRMLDHLTRAELREETREWSPAQWLARYEAALTDATEQSNAAFIRFCEDRHGDGWSGPQFADERALTVGHELRKAIDRARAGRIPAEVADAERAIADLSRAAQRARDVFKVGPINPALDPHAAAVVGAAE